MIPFPRKVSAVLHLSIGIKGQNYFTMAICKEEVTISEDWGTVFFDEWLQRFPYLKLHS
jgi:hypothetical protein